MTGNIYYEIIFISILILFNAIFAASEIALVSINKNRIEGMAKEGHKKAKMVLHLLSEPSRFLATIQVGITLGGFFASASAAVVISEELNKVIMPILPGIVSQFSKEISIFAVTIVLSYFTLVMGELVPKRLALKNPEKIAMSVVGLISFVSKVTYPFVSVLSISTNMLMKILGKNIENVSEKVTEEEIKLMIDVGEENGVINKIEKEMIHGIFKFDNTVAREVMTHRKDMFAIDVTTPYKDIIELLIKEKYSRIPVYEGSVDNIVGVLFVKDLFTKISVACYTDFDIKEILRKPFFVYESKNIDILLQEFRSTRNSIAMVIDEYGGIAGLITIKDILEEIVGSITDEYDDAVEAEIEHAGENVYILTGTAAIRKINEKLGLKLPVQPFGTISGFILSLIGYIPLSGKEVKKIEYNNMVFEVLEIKEKRIEKIRMTVKKDNENEEN